jgi:glutamyl-tRNA(Gln) amidotransferase subunit E
MYPETDIPPLAITKAFLDEVQAKLPEPAEKKRDRLIRDYRLNAKLARQIVDSEYRQLFEMILKESTVSATALAAFLTETVKSLKREGVQTEAVSDDQLREIFQKVSIGELAREATSDVFVWLSKNEHKSVQDAVDALSLRVLSQKELSDLIDRVVYESQESLEKMGKNAFGTLMGLVMREVRGKADPAIVARCLKDRIG